MMAGTITAWLDFPVVWSLALIGIDSQGRPFVTANPSGAGHIVDWLVRGVGQYSVIGDGDALGIAGDSSVLSSGPISWFVNRRDQLTMYSDSTGLQVVGRSVAGPPWSTPNLQPAGDCR
jgi:hypothetical protein